MKLIIYNTKEEALADRALTYDLLPESEKYIFVDPNGIGPSIPSSKFYSDLYSNVEETLWAISADESVESLLGKTSVESEENWLLR